MGPGDPARTPRCQLREQHVTRVAAARPSLARPLHGRLSLEARDPGRGPGGFPTGRRSCTTSRRNAVGDVQLQGQALVAWREQLAPLDLPDTGSLRGDIEAIVERVSDFSAVDRWMMGVISGIATAAARDPELKAAFHDQVLARPRGLVRKVLERAVERGEIAAERKLELVPEVLIGLNLLRLVEGKPPDRAFIRRSSTRSSTRLSPRHPSKPTAIAPMRSAPRTHAE